MRLFVECAFPYLGKRGAVSRKSAFCNLRLTEKRSLEPVSHGKAHSGLIDSRKSALCDPQIAQNALFRDVAAPGRCGATPRQPAGRLARGSADLGLSLTSRKGALCPTGGLQNAPFRKKRRHPPEAHSAPVDFSNAQSRSSQLTLPLNPERSRSARSLPSGSVRRTASGVRRTASCL